MIEKKYLTALALLATAAASPTSNAFIIDPARCTHDDLAQGAPSEGRNNWFRKCDPRFYRMVFSEGEFKLNHVVHDRRLYVTFGVSDEAGGFRFPGDWKAPINETEPCNIPESYGPIGVCTSGCYAPDTRLQMEEGLLEIRLAMASKAPRIVTLSKDSSREHITTSVSEVRNYLADVKDAQQELLEFHTASGGAIVVTLNHPLLDSEGHMRRAESLIVGDALVKADGQSDTITSISGRSYFGKVYNVAIRSNDDLENVVIANGFLNGSLYYQNEAGTTKLNQKLFRQAVIPASLIGN